ncbi:MAG: FAD-dependent oxidoreductase [Saprospiraceae bacterium]
MKILVIGQGIAGSVLSFVLERAGADVYLAEGDLPGSASRVAAGIINPVTGKRFVKSWHFDEFYPVARRIYTEIQQTLGLQVWEPQSILRLLQTPEEQNNWSARCTQPDYESYLSEVESAGAWTTLLKKGFSYGLISNAARVRFPELMEAYHHYLLNKERLISQQIKYVDIPQWLTKFDRIVFCEGFRASENPYFPDLPWQIAKGEALLIRFHQNSANAIAQMVKKTSLIAPVGDGLFWAGGSYQWHYDDYNPSEGEKSYILQRLEEMLDAKFDIVDHVAGVRPTVKDRRPFLGESRVLSNVFIFNGLGTKGALLAPYWAEHLAANIFESQPIDPEVEVHRNR